MAAPQPVQTERDFLLDEIARDPARVRRVLDGMRAEEKLSDFAALMWPILEPRRKLIRGYAWDAICEHLEAVHYGQVRRLLINVPPGFSKSLLCDVFFPAWEWGPRNRPDLRTIGFSYNIELTKRDNRRCRNLIRSELYQELWGDRFFIVSDQDAKTRYDTNHAGFKMATSVGGTGTGERGDRLMIDDPNNVKTVESDTIRNETNFWFAEVTPTRITDPDLSAIVVIQQRTHAKDVSGLILDSELAYEHLCLPMEYEAGRRCFTTVPREGVPTERVRRIKLASEPISLWQNEAEPIPENAEKVGPVRDLTSQDWRTKEGELLAPDRFSERHLEEDLKPALRLVGGTYAEAGQLQQSPSPRGGGLFQRTDFQVLELSAWPKRGNWARGYDLAASTEMHSAWSASAKIAVIGGDTYIANADRIKGRPGAVMDWMVATAEQDGVGVEIDFPQDPGQAGKWQRGFIAGKLGGYLVRSSPESGSKEDRAGPLAAQGENGNLYLLRGPWNDPFISEACNFPRGEFKDQVDAASRAYARALKLATSGESIPVAPKVIKAGG